MEINNSYLSEETKQKIRKSFLHSDFPAVILKDFFNKKSYAELQKKVLSLQFRNDQVVIHHSYASSKITLSHPALCGFISSITKKKVDKLNFIAYLASWKDYQILHDKYVEKPGIDVVIDLTDNWNPDWGGVVAYTDGRGTAYPITPAANSVAIVGRKKNLHKYIQYLNHHGKGKKRMFLIATL